MKKLVLMVSLVVTALFAMTSSLQAQSKSLPIDSVASAVSYNLKNVAYGYGSLWSQSLIQTNGSKTQWFQTYNHGGVPRLEDLKQMIATNAFAFMLARPSNDVVSAYISFNSADGDQLFWMGNGFNLVKSNGVWEVPDSVRTNAQQYLGYYQPIYEKNAIGARLNIRDKKGNVLETIYLEVIRQTINPVTPVTPVGYTTTAPVVGVGSGSSAIHMGRILNITQYLGQYGEMIVTYAKWDEYGVITNTYEVSFMLDEGKGGVAMTPAYVKASINPNWDPLIKILVPPQVRLTNVLSDENDIGTSPLVQITVTNEMVVYFHADTTRGEVSNGVRIKLLQEDCDWPFVPYTNSPGSDGQGILLPIGVYHIDFTWLRLKPKQYYPYYYYSGGGKGI